LTTRRPSRGQALIEFALVLPILLMLIVGGAGVGLLILNRMILQQAANELAIEASATDCSAAMNRTDEVLGYQPDSAACDEQGQLFTVTLSHSWPALIPLLPETVAVQGRALKRADPPAPSPSAVATP
jgi:hypothetical protein